MKKNAPWPVLILAVTVFVYTLTELRHFPIDFLLPALSEGDFQKIMEFRPFKFRNFLIIGAFVTASLLLHLNRAKGNPRYLKTLIRGEDYQKGRIYYLDYLRALAVVFVIGVHVMEYAYQRITPRTIPWEILACLATICLSCNLLFIMLSGALLLNGRDEPLSVFYLKRVSRVIIPFFAYHLFYSFNTAGIMALHPRNWGQRLGEFISNSDAMPPHFWLIYVILSLYIVTPFFKIMLKHMSDKMLASMVIIILIFSGLRTYLPLIQCSLAISTILGSWEAIFIIGYFWTRTTSDRYYKPLMAAGSLSLLLSVLIFSYYDRFNEIIYNSAPTMIIFASAIFMFFKKHSGTCFKKPSFIVAMLNKYSFSILLIHWFVLFDILESRLSLTGLSFGIIGGTPLSIFLTLVLSLVFAIFFDNTIILCMDSAFHFIVYGCSTLKKRLSNGSYS